MGSAKLKIQIEIDSWVKNFPHEFELFKKALELRRNPDNLHTKWAEVKGADMIERLAYCLPEVLQGAIDTKLDEAETEWFRTTQATKWFMRKYPVFRFSKSA